MNKIISAIRTLCPLLVLVLGFVFLFVPFPFFVIESLFVMDFCFALYLFLIRLFTRKTISVLFPKQLIYFCIFTCAVAIATTRTFLSTSDINDQIPFIKFMGEWICRESCLCGFFATLGICILILEFCNLHIERTIRLSADAFFDNASTNFIGLNLQQMNKTITAQDANLQKSILEAKSRYYDSLKNASKFLTGTLLAFTILFVVCAGGGTATGILELHLYWKDSLYQYIPLSCGYLAIFILPLFLASMSLCIGEKEEG